MLAFLVSRVAPSLVLVSPCSLASLLPCNPQMGWAMLYFVYLKTSRITVFVEQKELPTGSIYRSWGNLWTNLKRDIISQ